MSERERDRKGERGGAKKRQTDGQRRGERERERKRGREREITLKCFLVHDCDYLDRDTAKIRSVSPTKDTPTSSFFFKFLCETVNGFPSQTNTDAGLKRKS